MDPFKVFPHIVWEAILERVDSYVDKISMIRSYPALEKYFESKINEWHLAAVIQILVKTLNNTEFIKLLEPHLVSLRILSKTICNVVDKLIECRWDNCGQTPFNLYFCNRAGHNAFTMGFRVRRFIKKFEDHPPNRVTLVNPLMIFEVPFCNSPALPDITEEERIEVVRKAGPHLKGLCLELDMHDRPEDSIERSRVQLELIFRLTPKLAHLSIPGIRLFRINDVALMQEIQTTAKLNLPELPYLRYIDIGTKVKPALADFLGLDKYFPQLTRLTLMWDHWKEEYSSRAADVFPNLQYLSFVTPLHLNYQQPSYSRVSYLPEFRTRLINIYKMQAPKIKGLYFEIVHGNKDVLKSIIRVETRNGLTYLRKRFQGECNWKWKIHSQLLDTWRYSLFRTNKTVTDNSDFPDDNLEVMIENAIMEEENAVRQQELNELRMRNEIVQARNEERTIQQQRNEQRIMQQRDNYEEMIRSLNERIRILELEKEKLKTEKEEVKGDSCVKTVLKVASAATAILSAGVVIGKRVNK